MNITPLNSYQSVNFSANNNKKSSGRYIEPKHVSHAAHTQNPKHTTKKRKSNPITPAKVAGTTAASAALLAALFIPSCNQQKDTKPANVPTIETYETIETTAATEPTVQATTSRQPIFTTIIQTKPQNERKAIYHEVVAGDRLADIVKTYADLDKLTPDEELIPYYEILEQDNPGKWSDRNNIMKGIRIRIDGIKPENIEKVVINTSDEIDILDEETLIPVLPTQETSIEDTVEINDCIFTFDKGTLNKKAFGDYEGMIYGNFATLDKKMNGNVILTKYEGANSKSNKSQEITYDEDGKITQMQTYQDGKVIQIQEYSYKTNSTVETTTDKTAKSGLIDQVITEYSRATDFVNSKTFMKDGKVVAKFDFENKAVTIGENSWILNSFECNEEAIGADKYTGILNGKQVQFDVLKSEICLIEYNSSGDVQSREEYSLDGKLISKE